MKFNKEYECVKYYIDSKTSLLTICSWCKGMKNEEVKEMHRITKILEKKYNNGNRASHGICDECDKIY